MKKTRYWMLCLALLWGLSLRAADENGDDQKTLDFAERMMLLRPSTTVLRVGKMTAKWGEVQGDVKQLLAPKSTSDGVIGTDERESKIRAYFTKLAIRGVFLQEAQALKLEVTDAERAEYEKELSLVMKKRGKTLDDYKNALSTTPSTLVSITYEDTLRLVKLENAQIGEGKLTKEQLEAYRRYIVAVNNSFENQNQQRRQRVDVVRNDPKITTDKGFAELAKEYSEGKEGDFGGELDYDFTRQDLAEINGIPSFDWKVGEVTPVFEMKDCYRIMRVLRVVSPAQGEQPERLRVAQLLFKKLPLNDTSDAYIRLQVLPRMRQAKTEEYAKKLSEKYPIISCLFPDGLWEPKERK